MPHTRDDIVRKISALSGVGERVRHFARLRLGGATDKEIADALRVPEDQVEHIEEAVQGVLAEHLPHADLRAYLSFATPRETKNPREKKFLTAATNKKSMPVRSIDHTTAHFAGEAEAALSILEGTKNHIFLTGKAGTGKSTLLARFRATTKKNIVVTAPTGVAALNVSGQTIHSFFAFGPGTSPGTVRKVRGPKAKIYKKLDAIVIDEVSMARCDIIDCIDERMRLNGPDPKKPFGGVQMIFVGDLFQLPPVVTRGEERYFSEYYKSPFFFDAKVFSRVSLRLVELTRIWRQANARFIDVLDRIRRNDLSDEHIRLLNTRYKPGYREEEGFSIHLMTTNAAADAENARRLADLKGPEAQWNATVTGNFSEAYAPAPSVLRVRQGAQIMMLNNDKQGRWVNGDIGKVCAVNPDSLSVELAGGAVYDISRVTWDIARYEWDEETDRVESIPTGSFTQFPVRLAWAVTIHKGQGKTFTNIIVDMGRGAFAAGQAYVALSRCTTLEGVVLLRPFEQRHVLVDPRVVSFMDTLRCPQDFRLGERR